jgi:osmotically-inducible protein OsmY
MNANNITVVNNNGNANTGAMNSNRWSNTNVTREEYDKNKADYEKEKGTSTIGTGANDSWLWFKTRAALLAASDLRESTINVDVVNGVITLKGTVANAAQKASAVKVANGIEGKASVKDELKVAANDSLTNTSTTDSDKKANTNVNKK